MASMALLLRPTGEPRMPWTAITDHNALDSGATLRIETGYSDTPPQNGETIAVTHGSTGEVATLTVVSAAADRLEVSTGDRYLVLKPHAATKPNILDHDGRYREVWIVS